MEADEELVDRDAPAAYNVLSPPNTRVGDERGGSMLKGD